MTVRSLDGIVGLKTGTSGGVDVDGLMKIMNQLTPAERLAALKTSAVQMRTLVTGFLTHESTTWRENAKVVLAMLDKNKMPGGTPDAAPVNFDTGKEKAGWKP